MIPLQLHLKNFLSYGAEPVCVNFSSYPLICLSGKNGHGKSAMLDALTWALWGQARKLSGIAKADSGLLRLGQTHMSVVLDFELNRTAYRVKREYMLSYGKPVAQLEVGMRQEGSDKFVSLTGKTIRETQAFLEGLLRLDYESFINSAFLRQGQSHEFSKKSPKERKDVLAAILGLNQFDTMRKLATEKVKHAQQEIANYTVVCQKLQEECNNMPNIVEQCTAVDTALNKLDATITLYVQERQELERAQQTFVEEQNVYERLRINYEHLETREKEHIDIVRSTFTAWRLICRKAKAVGDCADLENRKKNLMQQLVDHQKVLQQNLELKATYLQQHEKLQTLEKQLHEQWLHSVQAHRIALERIILARKSVQEKAADNDKVLNEQLALCTKLETEHRRIKELLAQKAAHQQTLQALEKKFEKRKTFYQKYIAEGKWRSQELESLEHKANLSQDENNPSCPLCEQNLSASRRKFLKQSFSKQLSFIKHRLNRLTRVVKNLKAQLVEDHARLESERTRAQLFVTLEAQLSEVQRQHMQARVLCAQLQESRVHLVADLAKLDTEYDAKEREVLIATQGQTLFYDQTPAYKELHVEVTKLQQALTEVPYNATEHQRVQQGLLVLENGMKEYEQLQRELHLQEERKVQISEQCARIQEIRTQRKEVHQRLEEQLKKLAKKKELDGLQKQVLLLMEQKQHEKERLLQEKGRLSSHIDYLKKVEQQIASYQTQIAALQKTIDDYQAIVTAAGKDGIQALLIEEAIPEIEQEANALLARLTNNQAQIFIESLRDLKKGGTKETLDIKISDGAGIRPYELFSGGEAFRIDFALRIAISKLLARRAGTSLQTLIIDEGFGSQDEEGLSHIMDAIYKIQEDFAKVIVVSHLSTMKDQFPVHLMVEKGPSGSAVRVIELG